MIKITTFNLENFTKPVNIPVPWNTTDAYVCTFFFLMGYQKAHNLVLMSFFGKLCLAYKVA